MTLLQHTVSFLDDRRCGLNPQIVETLLFLKENRDYWSQAHVAKALKIVKGKNRSERLKKKMEAEKLSEKISAAAFGKSKGGSFT